MSMINLNSKVLVQAKLKFLKEKYASLGFTPQLTIIQVGDKADQNIFIEQKKKIAAELGVKVNHVKLESNVKLEDILHVINIENNKANGIIVQLPLTKNLQKQTQTILDAIKLDLDIEGLGSKNGEFFYKQHCRGFTPPVAKAVESLIKYYNITIRDKKVMIINDSILCGKPLEHLLIDKYKAIVRVTNKEKGLQFSDRQNIIITAAGVPNLINENNIKDKAIIFDVGFTVLEDGQIVGDVDTRDIAYKAAALSPVPGGVGPLVVVSLFENLLSAIRYQEIKWKEEQERLAKEKALKEEQERLEQERIAKEKALKEEQERIAKEKAAKEEQERLAKEEQERLAAEEAKKQQEAEEKQRLAEEEAKKQQEENTSQESILNNENQNNNNEDLQLNQKEEVILEQGDDVTVVVDIDEWDDDENNEITINSKKK